MFLNYFKFSASLTMGHLHCLQTVSETAVFGIVVQLSLFMKATVYSQHILLFLRLLHVSSQETKIQTLFCSRDGVTAQDLDRI